MSSQENGRLVETGWKTMPLSKACIKITDGTHHSPRLQFPNPAESRFKYVTSKNLRPWGLDLADIAYVDEKTHREIYSRCNPTKGDVLLTKDGANTGMVAINTLDEEISLLSSVAVLKPDPTLTDSRFLRYFIESPVGSDQLVGKMTGTAIRRIILRQIKEAQISLPSVPEQRRIVAEIEKQFTRLESGVAALRRVQANLKRYRAAVLKAACEGLLVENDQQKWTSSKLGDVAISIKNGYSRKPDAEVGTRIFRISAVRRMRLEVNDVRYLCGEESNYAEFLVEPQDVLFTRYNGSRDFVGVCAVVPTGIPSTAYPDKLIRVRLPTDILLPKMLAILASAGKGRAFIESRIRTTAGQSGISGSDLKALPLKTPSLVEQRRIVAEVERRFSVVDELEATVSANLQRATRLRQSILARAFEARG